MASPSNSVLGLTADSQCKSCLAGTYSTVTGLALSSQCQDCPMGTFSTARQSCSVCPVGRYTDQESKNNFTWKSCTCCQQILNLIHPMYVQSLLTMYLKIHILVKRHSDMDPWHRLPIQCAMHLNQTTSL